MTLRRSSPSSPPGTVSLALTLALGLFVPMGGVQAQAPDTPLGPAGVVVDSIAVVGGGTFPEGVLRSTIGIVEGQQVTYQDVLAAERRLWATGVFRNLSVTIEGGPPDPVRLVFTVEEQPIVSGLSIIGLTRVSERAVWEAGEVEVGEPYSPARVARSERFIRDELVKRGIPFPQVTQDLVAVGGGSVFVTLRVTEGQRITVADIVFNGNDAVSDEELRGILTTQPEGFWWWKAGAFNEASLEEDLIQRLPDFYASRGHLDFTVLGDTLIVDPETGKARLEVDLSEGPRYEVASFGVLGNRVFPSDQLEQYYTEEEGGLLRALGLRGEDLAEGTTRTFDQGAFDEATRAVSDLYQNEGYLFASITPEIEKLPPLVEGGSPRVDVRWVIVEGEPAFVRYVHIEGNDHTHDWVIRDRIALLPGDRYSQDLLLRSYQAVQGLGFFETPLPYPSLSRDEATGDIDITFHVIERHTGTLNFGTTMAAYSGVTGFIGYTEPNLFGQGKSGDLRWDFGRYQNSFSLTYSDPALRRTRVSGSLSLFDTRDRYFSFASGERLYRGATVRFGFPIPGSFYTRFFAGYSISRTEYRLRSGDDTSLFGRPPGTQSQFNVSVARQTLDHPTFPTIGSQQVWTVEFNGGILGGDGDFTKHRLSGSWWIPVGQAGGETPGSRPIVFALGLKASAGAIFGSADAFPFDRFWVGGVQFGEQLRGYEETTITPFGYVERGSNAIQEGQRLGDAFLTLSAEYAIRLSDILSISAFFDAGNVWRTPAEVDPSRLRRSAGFGLEMVTPIIPTIGLDLGYGFDRPDPTWELHFRMGGGGL